MAKAVSLDMLKRFASRIGAVFVKKRSGYDLMSNEEKTKLSGIAAGANKYVHPAHTARTSGLYKITVDGEGHITAVVAATKADITALGIPGQDTNTTYSSFKAATTAADGGAGLVPGPAKGAANRYLRSDGSWQVPPDTNTWRGIQNVLTSTSTTESLSAAQGKTLNDRLTIVETLLDNIIAGNTIVIVETT